MAKSITKPKNAIPTVVLLDPAANKSVSRIQDTTLYQKSTSSVETIIEENTPIIEENEPIINNDENAQTSVDSAGGTSTTEIPVATDEDIQNIIDGYGNEENESASSPSHEEFDDSNMISATDEDIQNIINGYGN